MAKTSSSTTVYVDSRRLLDIVLDITPNFPREYKFSIGSRMHSLSVDLLLSLSAAYNSRDHCARLSALTDALSLFETLSMLVRIAGERHWISLRKFAEIVELNAKISKQIHAWMLSLNGKRMPESGGHG